MGQLDWNFRLPPGLFGLLMLGNQPGKNYCACGVIGPAYEREVGSLPHNGQKWGSLCLVRSGRSITTHRRFGGL